jgi:hypothetical protein
MLRIRLDMSLSFKAGNDLLTIPSSCGHIASDVFPPSVTKFVEEEREAKYVRRGRVVP